MLTKKSNNHKSNNFVELQKEKKKSKSNENYFLNRTKRKKGLEVRATVFFCRNESDLKRRKKAKYKQKILTNLSFHRVKESEKQTKVSINEKILIRLSFL